MKTTVYHRALALFAAALLSTTALAQTFPGSDDFSAGDTVKWDDDIIRVSTATAEGNFSFANDQLEFIKPATTGVYTNQLLRWNSGNGGAPDPFSFTTSWVMTVDVTNLLTPGVYTTIGLNVSHSTNSSGYASIVLGYDSTNGLRVRATGTGGVDQSVALTQNSDVTLSFAWDASAQTLSARYAIDGTTFTSVAGFDPANAWTTAPTDGFVLGIWAQTGANLAIGSGQLYADNFSVSAVPEPSTYAAIAGALMLGFAAWKRRSKRA